MTLTLPMSLLVKLLERPCKSSSILRWQSRIRNILLLTFLALRPRTLALQMSRLVKLPGSQKMPMDIFLPGLAAISSRSSPLITQGSIVTFCLKRRTMQMYCKCSRSVEIERVALNSARAERARAPARSTAKRIPDGNSLLMSSTHPHLIYVDPFPLHPSTSFVVTSPNNVRHVSASSS